jgi:hypothetical protein
LAKKLSVPSYMPESKPHLPANYMVSNNFSFPMTMEGRGGDRLLSKVNNNHHKHRKEGKESGKHIQLIE